MTISVAFLGAGTMGTELALHLVKDHAVTIWNRTPEKAAPVVEAGATLAGSVAEAVAGKTVVASCLFGPDTVREVLTGPDAISAGTLWLDATTVSPADAAAFAAWATEHQVRYVHTPVVGTVGPARRGMLGVYIGSDDPQARDEAEDLVRPWADPTRLQQVDSAPEAATAKLLANLALAISAQGLVEALRLGRAQGFSTERILDLLDKTGLAFIAGMKRNHLLTGAFDDAHFSADAIAKDVRMIIRSSTDPLPATTAALESLTRAQRAGKGKHDFSVITEDE